MTKKTSMSPGIADRPGRRRLVDCLTELVTTGLEPGARLPSEAELALTHGVSRLTVREALKELAGRGLVDTSQGRRAAVREFDGRAFGIFLAMVMQHDPKGLLDLLEVRRALEVQAASLAAQRITRAGVAAVRNMLEGMASAEDAMNTRGKAEAAVQQFHDYDVGFHEALALASGNRMLAHLIEALARPLRDAFRLSLLGRAQRGGNTAEVIAAHGRILAAVESRDARAAAQAMREHLEDAARDARAYLGRSSHCK